MDGWDANHEGTEAVMQAKARADQAKARADQTTFEDAPEGRGMQMLRSLWWSAVLVATLAGVVWAFGGTPVTIIAVVIATVGSLLLVVAWLMLRSVRQGTIPTEDH
ncbi:MAG: hypothetical protein ABI959_04340 [Candidatus Dormiibacterota bacterium]